MVKQRIVLWWLLIIGIIFHIFLMTNINVAIIFMTKRSKDSRVITDDKNQTDKFDWSDQQKSMIFGAFYWFAWAAELSGGVLSHKYGSKITFGLTNFIGCLLCSAIPVAAYISWKMVVVVRVVQGTLASVGLPAGIATIVGQWSPPDERGKFMSVILGLPMGIAIGYPFFGFIAEYLGWPYVFHITLALGTVWYLMWYYYVYDTPEKHPRISEKEKMYIKKSLASSAVREKMPIPWKKILTSRPLLINVMCTFGQSWAFFGTSIYLPMYLQNAHQISSTKIGIFTAISFLVKAGLQIFAGVATDIMIRRGMSKTSVRKIAVFIGTVIPGILLSFMVFVDGDVFWSLSLLIGYFIISSFCNCGTPVAVIDMSPNFCGPIQGMTCALTASTGFLCTLMFNLLSSYFDKTKIWGYFFLSCGLISAIPGIVFLLISNSELQPWNKPKEYTGEALRNLNETEGA